MCHNLTIGKPEFLKGVPIDGTRKSRIDFYFIMIFQSWYTRKCVKKTTGREFLVPSIGELFLFF